MTALSRRNFIRLGARISAAFAQPELQRAWPNGANDFFGDLPQAVGFDPLLSDPTDIANAFAFAKPGVLMLYYQNFWKLPFDTLKSLENPEHYEVAFKKAPWRIRAIAPIAYLHVLAELEGDDEVQHSYTIVTEVHERAKDRDRNREILEIIWQNVLTSLVRHPNTIIFPRELLRQGQDLCISFLEGESLLFSPAIRAFHAISMYLKALKGRPDSSGDERFVGELIAEILKSEKKASSSWFENLQCIVDDAKTVGVSPQLSDIWIAPGKYDRKNYDFSINARLHLLHQLHRVSEGEVSAFVTRERANAGKSALLDIFNQMFLREDKHFVRSKAEEQLGRSESEIVFRLIKDHQQNAKPLCGGGDVQEFSNYLPPEKFDTDRLIESAGLNRMDFSLTTFLGWSASAVARAFNPIRIAIVMSVGLMATPDIDFEEVEHRLREPVMAPTARDDTRPAIDRSKVLDNALSVMAGESEKIRASNKAAVGWSSDVANIEYKRNLPTDTFVTEESTILDGRVGSTPKVLQPRNRDASGVSYAGSAIEGAPSLGTLVDSPAMEVSTADSHEVSTFKEAPCTVNMPEYNDPPLRGESPEQVRARHKVGVEILRRKSARRPHGSIVIWGTQEHVMAYVGYLTESWPTEIVGQE